MQRKASTLFVIALVVLISVALAGIASTMALARPQRGHLGADLRSALSANYSADPPGTRLAPLGEEIIEAARRDSRELDQRAVPGDGPQIIPVFHADNEPPPS